MGAGTIFLFIALLIVIAVVIYYFYRKKKFPFTCCTSEDIKLWDFVYGEFVVPGGHWFGGEVGEEVDVLLYGNVCNIREDCFIDVIWYEGWNMDEPMHHLIGDKLSVDDEEAIFGYCDIDPLEDWSKWGDTGGIKSTIQSRNICISENSIRLAS